MSAVRITTAIPKNNLATAMLPGGYPIMDQYRFPSNRRRAFDSNKGGMRPKTWNSTCTTTAQVRLPIDEIGALAAGVFASRPFPQKPTTLSMVSEEAAKAYLEAKEKVRKDQFRIWKEWDYPPYYEYRPPYRTCWNFMVFPKFRASRVHQMRANKSYLNAQTDWSNQDRDPQCDRCGTAPQTFSHIITDCPALSEARKGYNMSCFDISPESDLWKEDKKGFMLIGGFISFIIETKINFPVRLEVFPFTRGSTLGS